MARSLQADAPGRRVLSRAAEVLATHSDPRLRHGGAAFVMAKAAADKAEADEIGPLESLAMAQAELGAFDEAVQTAVKALQMAEHQPGLNRSAPLTELIRSCEEQRPYRHQGWKAYEAGAVGDIPPARLLAFACQLAAEELLREEDAVAALLALTQATRLDPTYTPPRLMLANVSLNQGRPDLALMAVAEVCEREPQRFEAWQMLARAQQQLGHETEAIATHRTALRLRPDDLSTLNNLAWLLATLDDPQGQAPAEAIALAGRLCQAAPDDPSYLDTLGVALGAVGRFGEGAAVLRKAQSLAADQPKLAATLRVHRLLLEAHRPYREGQAPQNMAEPDDRRWHLQMGQGLFKAGRRDLAAGHIAAAIAYDPRQAEAYLALGRVRAAQGFEAQAIGAFAHAVRLRPGYSQASVNLAWLRAAAADARLRDAEDALFVAENVVALEPENWSGWDALGVAYAALERFDEAAAAAKRAQELLPSETDRQAVEAIAKRVALFRNRQPFSEKKSAAAEDDQSLAAALAELGALALRQGREDVAEKHLLAAKRELPDRADVPDMLGHLARQQGRFADAIALHRQAVKLSPETIDFRNNLAWALAVQPQPGDDDNAAEAVALAEKLCEPRAQAPLASLDTLAVALAAAGRFEEAVEVARSAQERATAAKDNAAAAQFASRVERFAKEQAYREPATGGLTFDAAYRAWHLRRGLQLLRSGDLHAAQRHLQAVLLHGPDALVLNELGETHRRLGDRRAAREHFTAALRADPSYINALNNLAWLLAASGDTSDDDRRLAVELAQRAVAKTAGQDEGLLDTLAVAQAAAGQFESAVKTVDRAIGLAKDHGKKELKEPLRRRREQFVAHRAYVETDHETERDAAPRSP